VEASHDRWQDRRGEGPAIPTLCQVVIDTTDARAAAEFWRQLLGLVYRAGHEPPSSERDDAAGRDWLNLFTPDGDPCLAFQQVPALEPTTWPADGVPQQLHLDLTVDTVDELDAIEERILDLGGELRVDRSDDPDEPLRVFTDPAGHTFCVFVA
jgi:catechol 2,3-dioxygenase-like lactoylglutathione lyase family enzyme